ncbi:MAG TPA: glycosyltransferase [Bacteroidales bacterium]
MITSFIFVNDGISYQYGIGKYLACLKENCYERQRLRLILIILGSKDIKEMRIVPEAKNISLVYFPSIPASGFEYQHFENARLIINTLEALFTFDHTTVFHFVSWNGFFIASVLKEQYDNPIIFDLHSLEWQFALSGNKEKFASYWETLMSNYENSISELIKPGVIYEKELCELADHVIVRTFQMKKDVIETYKLNNRRISVIYNGVETSRVIPRKEDSFKQELGFSSKEKIILFVGRLCDQKGILYLLKAFKIILSSYENTRLVIVGNGNYDSCLKECYGIWSKVIFTGRLDNEGLNQIYRIADIGVVPSIYEPFGYVLLEMMNRYIPIITTNIEGPNEIVDDGITGIKVNVTIDKNGERSIVPEELAEGIIKLLKRKTLAGFLIRKAHSKLRRQFRSSFMVKNLIKVYKNTLQETTERRKNTLNTVEISGNYG